MSPSRAAEPPRGCYTSARYEAGAVRHLGHHVRRVRRDAGALALPRPDEVEIRDALLASGRKAFAAGSGVVRLALHPASTGGPAASFHVTTRTLGPEAREWRLFLSPEPHPGSGSWPGVKREGVGLYARAREAALQAGADDALLLDADGFLVEGARTNVFVQRADGALVTPPLSRGGVAGVAREIILERVPEVQEEDVARAQLDAAREIILVNAIRGAVTAVALDGRVLGPAAAESWTERLNALLRSDPPPRH